MKKQAPLFDLVKVRRIGSDFVEVDIEGEECFKIQRRTKAGDTFIEVAFQGNDWTILPVGGHLERRRPPRDVMNGVKVSWKW